jgi:hypothetical protein
MVFCRFRVYSKTSFRILIPGRSSNFQRNINIIMGHRASRPLFTTPMRAMVKPRPSVIMMSLTVPLLARKRSRMMRALCPMNSKAATHQSMI